MERILIELFYLIFGLFIIISLIYSYIKSKKYNDQINSLIKSSKELEKNEAMILFKEDMMKSVMELETSAANGSYAESALNDLDQIFPPTLTGRHSIDLVLSNKTQRCEKNNITLNLNIAPVSFDNIIDIDLVPLFSNIIDNAIEAAALSVDKRIELTILNIKNCNIIKIINTKKANLTPLENNLNTTKQDSSKHGLGIKIIKLIVQKNDGKVNFIDNGDEFIIKIILPS
ncbi:MAG: sensor histidine kinase [Clostridiales bacterium]|nr:sensor histidine kinase [Clostridiales bacterium]